MLLVTNGQPFYWNNPTANVCLPTAEGPAVQVDDRVYRLEKMLNTFPGRVARKVYRGLRKIKHKIIK